MNKIIENLMRWMVIVAVLTVLPLVSLGQDPRLFAPPAKADKPTPPRPTERRIVPIRYFRGGDTSEKSIKVDRGVNLDIGCVTEGTVKINGWNRNEVRVFISDGTKFGFKVIEKNEKTGDPVWIKVIGMEPRSRYGGSSDCISGRVIEIDVPVEATINIKGQEFATIIDSVKKVGIKSIGGDISLRNVKGGIMASTGQGDITVETSDGGMNLSTTTGNILVFEAGPKEIGDLFKANTNSGSISLQKIDFRQINVDSISGSVAYSGAILTGAYYNLRTSKGSIQMSIPSASSFQFYATFGYGRFDCEIPYKISTENIMEGPIKSITGKAGNGEATLKLTTNNGSISIKKQ